MMSTLRALRKAAVFILGIVVLLAGLIMIVTPGPGLLGIIAGLLILSIEFEWAERYLKKARQKLKETNDKIRNKSSKDVDRTGNHKGKRKS